MTDWRLVYLRHVKGRNNCFVHDTTNLDANPLYNTDRALAFKAGWDARSNDVLSFLFDDPETAQEWVKNIDQNFIS